MQDDAELLLNFKIQEDSLNRWQGSLRYNKILGSKIRVLSDLLDAKTDLRHPLDVNYRSAIVAEADLTKTIILMDLNEDERSINFDSGVMSATTNFTSKAIAVGLKDKLYSIDIKSKIFTISSPIIFSFMNQKTYKFTASQKNNRVTLKDIPIKPFKFQSKVFKEISFHIGRSFGSSADGDVAKINYDANMVLVSRKPMDVFEILRLSQFFEKLLFLLVGSHCGPMDIEVKGKNKKDHIYDVNCSSPFYNKTSVVNGLYRCWTIDRMNLDFGQFFDRSLASYSSIETCLELILEAELEESPQTRFFKLVRATENIGRNLFPSGNEQLPDELIEIENAIKNNENLKAFFSKRIKPILSRPNSLGRTIDFIKKMLPIWPISDLEKSQISRLRGIEAHARAHQFSPEDIGRMHYLGDLLDFSCRASLLRFLGMEFEDIIGVIFHNSRFSWFVQKEDLTKQQVRPEV